MGDELREDGSQEKGRKVIERGNGRARRRESTN